MEGLSPEIPLLTLSAVWIRAAELGEQAKPHPSAPRQLRIVCLQALHWDQLEVSLPARHGFRLLCAHEATDYICPTPHLSKDIN